MKKITLFILALLIIITFLFVFSRAEGAYRFDQFQAVPPIHILGTVGIKPLGISPALIKKNYHLPETGGKGTVAVIDAYADPSLEKDLAVFDQQFNLPDCTVKNFCLEIHKIGAVDKTNRGWNLETSLDVEWAHAIAPKAKILLIEVPTPSGANLTKGIDYARSRSEVVAVSMSWGGKEFSDETNLDSHFKNTPIKFFASSGDNGAGASWPAASPFVISVGGTSLKINSNGNFLQETAWTGSSGGISKYESEPSWQKAYNILQAKGKRAIPDVAYNADPHSGFSVYFNKGWYVLGGTSAGAPQWAAIEALGHSVDITKLYQDKSQNDYASFFRDITSGRNGDCVYYCVARRHYDYVTGLGTPQTVDF